MGVLVPVRVLCGWVRDVGGIHGEQPDTHSFTGEAVNELELRADLKCWSVLDVPIAFQIASIPPRKSVVFGVLEPVRVNEEKRAPLRHVV